jgi:probable HAF family extracellular repeat protein
LRSRRIRLFNSNAKGKEIMNSRMLTCITSMILLAPLGTPLAVQAQPEHHPNQTHYLVKDLGTLGGTAGVAEGISDRGWVVGDANLAGDQSGHAFLWRDGVMTDLGTLGGLNSQEQWPVKDNRGLIVGDAETSAMDPFNEDFCGFDANSSVPPTGLICLGFLWHDGVMTALPTLGGNNAQALGVNNRGQVVGMAETGIQDANCAAPQVFDVEAVIWGPQKGVIHELPPLPGDASSWATGINDREQVVGVSGNCVSPNFNAGGGVPQHGVIWENGAAMDLGNLGGTLSTFPWAINSKGQAVGKAYIAGDIYIHTFLWEKGVIKDLGVIPGDVISGAFGLNDRGEVVGGSCDQNFNCRAYLWQDGLMTDINTLVKPGSTPLYLVFGNDINSQGEIAAYAFDQSHGEFHAALAIPCDEKHAGNQACNDDSQGTIAATERPRVVLPENVRQHLRKRLGFSNFTLSR